MGNLYTSAEEREQWWTQHFTGVPNRASTMLRNWRELCRDHWDHMRRTTIRRRASRSHEQFEEWEGWGQLSRESCQRWLKLGAKGTSSAPCFQKERRCSDIIFALRQLIAKSWEHRAKVYFLFIDIRKAYDSVPKAAMWRALGKLGVPDFTIKLIRSFHQGTQAKLRTDVTNGLR